MASELEIRDLCVEYDERRILRQVNLSLKKGQILGIAGESGSGKSTLLRSIVNLLPENGRISGGKICLDRMDLASLSVEQMRQLRGERIAMIFQNTSTSLCPVMTVGHHFRDAIRSHRRLERKQDEAQVAALLQKLGLGEGRELLNCYPFELSGGMCQRISIALAMVLNPDFLLADEPTSALDVTVQTQVLRQLDNLRTLFGTGILIVSHNLDAIGQLADMVGILYAGRLLEMGPKEEVMRHPLHPYTQSLLSAIPRIGGGLPQGIPGRITREAASAPCCFFNRCAKAESRCKTAPAPQLGTKNHWALCHRAEEEKNHGFVES